MSSVKMSCAGSGAGSLSSLVFSVKINLALFILFILCFLITVIKKMTLHVVYENYSLFIFSQNCDNNMASKDLKSERSACLMSIICSHVDIN